MLYNNYIHVVTIATYFNITVSTTETMGLYVYKYN